MNVEKECPFIISFVTDPVELAQAEAQRRQFDKNVKWLEACVNEVYAQNRGKCICVAGQELFAADTAQEVIDLARNAHPDDKGMLLEYVPKQKMVKIYAHLRLLAGG